jgi:hypothetical protein
MIQPPPAAINCGVATTMVFYTPVRLVSKVSCHTAGVTSSQARTVQIPALAHDAQPTQLGHANLDRLLQATSVTHIGRSGDDATVEGFPLLHGLSQVGLGRQPVRQRVVVLVDVDRDDVDPPVRPTR